MAQKDIHAYGTLAIAKAAGYSDEDALLLAWSNTETDKSLQVTWRNVIWSNLGLYFHFVPSNPKDLICRPDSELCKRIIASVAVSKPQTWRHYMAQDLIALGIALHSVVQDPYFHNGWTGKFSRHNVLPAWANDKFTPSLPFPYGHSPKGREPDIANATWYDPRTNSRIVNIERVEAALDATAVALGGNRVCVIDEIAVIFRRIQDYEARKQALRELVGLPDLRFSDIRREMLAKYGKEYRQAAANQVAIVKGFLKGESPLRNP